VRLAHQLQHAGEALARVGLVDEMVERLERDFLGADGYG